MFDFEPTEEQRALIETARRFARERIIPIAAECDRESQFPRHVFEEAHGIGLVNPTLPAEYGGAGLSDVESSFITEELAYGCSGIQTSMTANTLGLTPIKLAGSEEQKKKYLGWLVERADLGRVRDERARRGQRRGGDAVQGDQGRQRGLRPERHQAVDHQRDARKLLRGVRDRGPGPQHKGIGAFIVERTQAA